MKKSLAAALMFATMATNMYSAPLQDLGKMKAQKSSVSTQVDTRAKSAPNVAKPTNQVTQPVVSHSTNPVDSKYCSTPLCMGSFGATRVQVTIDNAVVLNKNMYIPKGAVECGRLERVTLACLPDENSKYTFAGPSLPKRELDAGYKMTFAPSKSMPKAIRDIMGSDKPNVGEITYAEIMSLPADGSLSNWLAIHEDGSRELKFKYDGIKYNPEGKQCGSDYLIEVGSTCPRPKTITVEVPPPAPEAPKPELPKPQPLPSRVRAVKTDITFGQANVNDFAPKINGQEYKWGEWVTLSAQDVAASKPIAFGEITKNSAFNNMYTTKLDSACDAILKPGDDITCTYTNVPTFGKLVIEKRWTLDDGGKEGTAVVYVDGTQAKLSEETITKPGKHVVTELPVQYFEPAKYSGDCDADGNVDIIAGKLSRCIVENDDIRTKVTIKKIVENDNGRTAEAQDFEGKLLLNGEHVSDGDVIVSVPNRTLVMVNPSDKVKPGELYTRGYKLVNPQADKKGEYTVVPGNNILEYRNVDLPIWNIRGTALIGDTALTAVTKLPTNGNAFCPAANCQPNFRQGEAGKTVGDEIEAATSHILVDASATRNTMSGDGNTGIWNLGQYFAKNVRTDRVAVDGNVMLNIGPLKKSPVKPWLNGGMSYTTRALDGKTADPLHTKYFTVGAGIGDFTKSYLVGGVGMTNMDQSFLYPSVTLWPRQEPINLTTTFAKVKGQLSLFDNHVQLFGTAAAYKPANTTWQGRPAQVSNMLTFSPGVQVWVPEKVTHDLLHLPRGLHIGPRVQWGDASAPFQYKVNVPGFANMQQQTMPGFNDMNKGLRYGISIEWGNRK